MKMIGKSGQNQLFRSRLSILGQAPSVSNSNEMVWDSNSEGYIANSIASALLELENNPPAAGRSN